jgi:hypothetical protein
MLMMKERPVFRTIEGWARLVLLEAGAIRECEEHGWMRDRRDPHAREHALLVARHYPPRGVSSDEAAATVEAVLCATGDTCPDCPPESDVPLK